VSTVLERARGAEKWARVADGYAWLPSPKRGGVLYQRMRRYDPAVPPNAQAWLALDEQKRIDLIREYHQSSGISLPSIEAHATAHVVVENQLAEGLPAAVNAFGRLTLAGLDRHEAVHAIGAVLMNHLWNLANGPLPSGDTNQAYFAALDALTRESWENGGES
jgi:hypothetical protein